MRNKNQLPFDFINRENTNTLTRFKESMPQFMYVVQASGNEVIYNSDVYFRVDINNIWVDNAGKDTWDGTFRQPFQTIGRALEIANSGDTINVLPGSYSGSFALKDRVNFNFFSDANVYNSGFNPIFTTTGSTPINTNILGKGNFYCTADFYSGPDNCLIMESNSDLNNIYFEFDECGLHMDHEDPTVPDTMFRLRGNMVIEGESVKNIASGAFGNIGSYIFENVGEGDKTINLQSAYCYDGLFNDGALVAGGNVSFNIKNTTTSRYSQFVNCASLFSRITMNIETVAALGNLGSAYPMFYVYSSNYTYINIGTVEQKSSNILLTTYDPGNLFFKAKSAFGQLSLDNFYTQENIEIDRLAYSGDYPIVVTNGNNTIIKNTTVYNLKNSVFAFGAYVTKHNSGVLYLKNTDFRLKELSMLCLITGVGSVDDKNLISMNNVVSNKPLTPSLKYNGTFLEMPLPDYVNL
jgi:hypothetical protein